MTYIPGIVLGTKKKLFFFLMDEILLPRNLWYVEETILEIGNCELELSGEVGRGISGQKNSMNPSREAGSSMLCMCLVGRSGWERDGQQKQRNFISYSVIIKARSGRS